MNKLSLCGTLEMESQKYYINSQSKKTTCNEIPNQDIFHKNDKQKNTQFSYTYINEKTTIKKIMAKRNTKFMKMGQAGGKKSG